MNGNLPEGQSVGIVTNMKAELILRQKEILDNGLVISMTVWKLPEPNAERPHGIKYSFHCGTLDGKTIVRYDNEHGKGDHRHYDGTETRYEFTTLDTLIRDFLNDVNMELSDAQGND